METLIKKIQNLCIKNKLTISVVESCTSGKLGDILTSNSGSSKWFLGGFIVYNDEIKSKLLGIYINKSKSFTSFPFFY
jgi:nicotinamide-nucleotide amidase